MTKIRVEKKVRSRNDEIAQQNRERFGQADVVVVNLLSSPGSGKTSILAQTGRHMGASAAILVVGGDVETERDADRLRAQGMQALQIQTHGACHLSAQAVARKLEGVDLHQFDLLLIENVGNLICPTGFDLGEDARVVLASTAEGEDKPAKYPEAYHGADACVLNKIDLLPHVPFDEQEFQAAAMRANLNLRMFRTSCTTGEGIDQWCRWLKELIDHRSSTLSRRNRRDRVLEQERGERRE